MLMSGQDTYNDYDSEPVRYCARCYSLKIKYDEDIDSDYCMDCGCTDTVESLIEDWEKKYEAKYGHKYTEKSNNIKKSPIFQLSINKLMQKVYDSQKWETIIRTIYKNFPRGLSRADSIVLFFDTLIKGNRLDDLRELLYRMKI